MLCENYRESLRNAAVGGGMTAELRSHLEVCAECSTAFAREQTLLTAINANLRTISNAEVPASLLPRVKAAAAELPSPALRPRSAWAWAPAVAAAVFAIALILPKFAENPRRGDSPVNVVGSVPSAPLLGRNRPSLRRSPPPLQAARVRRPSPRMILASTAGTKVLVPPGQEAALAHYIAVLQRQPVLAQILLEDRNRKPLQLEPLEIAELSSQPLAIEPLSKNAGRTTQ
jgi:hypothetical protein